MTTLSPLREYVGRLEETGELRRISRPVSAREVAALTEDSDQALLLEHVAGAEFPLVANAMASRRAWATALDVPERDVLHEIRRRLEHTHAPVLVEDGPVKEVILRGDEVDLGAFPLYLQHELDGAPYISAAMDVTRKTGGGCNLGMRRLMVRTLNETGVDVVAPSDLRAAYREARQEGRAFPIAFVVGGDPLDYLATQLRVPAQDEYELAGALRQRPAQLVRAETSDLPVPADAEIVLEGHLEGDWTEAEGPYGEYTGCYGAPHINPVFKISAITMRSDPLFLTATISGRRLDHTDTALLVALGTELCVWESLERAVARPKHVYCPPAATGMHSARISIQSRDPGDGRNAVMAALASRGEIKMATVVDDDVDVFDDRSMEWALATRYQADVDTVVLSGLRTLPLDPSLPPHEGSEVVTAKLGLDATRRRDKPAEVFTLSAPPYPLGVAAEGEEAQPDMSDVSERVRELAAEGCRFVDVLRSVPEATHRTVLRAIGQLRNNGEISLGRDGLYWATGPAAVDHAQQINVSSSE